MLIYVLIYITIVPVSDKKQMTVERVKELFREQGGVMRTRDALRRGVHPATLYAMRDRGLLAMLTRGVYHLCDAPLDGSDDLVAVAHRVPKARICLISALAFHDLTTQIPHVVYCALPRHVNRPKVDHPPVRYFIFSRECYEDGVEYHEVSGTRLAVYSIEKTLADCFKYRNQIGMDTVMEALRLYRARKTLKVKELMAHARICRVHNILTPYIEAIL